MTEQEAIEQVAAQIIADREKLWTRPLDNHARRFAKAAVVQALHSGKADMWLDMYHRWKTAEAELKALRGQRELTASNPSKPPTP